MYLNLRINRHHSAYINPRGNETHKYILFTFNGSTISTLKYEYHELSKWIKSQFKNLHTPSFFQYMVSGVILGPVFVYIFTLVFLKDAMFDTF